MSESLLSTKQQIALELTKTLIEQGHSDPAKQAIEYAETILQSGKKDKNQGYEADLCDVEDR